MRRPSIRTQLSALSVVGVALLAAPVSASGGQAGRSGHLHDAHRTDSAAELPELSPPGLGRADVFDHLRGGPALGAEH